MLLLHIIIWAGIYIRVELYYPGVVLGLNVCMRSKKYKKVIFVTVHVHL